MRRQVKASSPTRSPHVPCGIMAGGPPSLLLSSSNCMRSSSSYLGVEVAIAPQWLLNSIERRGPKRRASFSTQPFPSLHRDIFSPLSDAICAASLVTCKLRFAPISSFSCRSFVPSFHELRSLHFSSHFDSVLSWGVPLFQLTLLASTATSPYSSLFLLQSQCCLQLHICRFIVSPFCRVILKSIVRYFVPALCLRHRALPHPSPPRNTSLLPTAMPSRPL